MTGLLAAALRDSEERRLARLGADAIAEAPRAERCLGCPARIVQSMHGGRPKKYCSANCRMRYLRSMRPAGACRNCAARVEATRELVEALNARIRDLEARITSLGGEP